MDRLLFSFAASGFCILLTACDLPRSMGGSPAATTLTHAKASAARTTSNHPSGSPDAAQGERSDEQKSTNFAWGPQQTRVRWHADRIKNEATIRLIQSNNDSPAPLPLEKIQLIIDSPLTEIELIAQPIEGDAQGTSSRFVGTHPTLGLKKPLSGSISAMVDKQPYVSDFSEPYDLFDAESQ